MRLVHVADLHLGFRQYQRLTESGINQREADVARTFRAVIDRTIELRPDVVVVAGDVFHSVRPTNPAILQAVRQFLRLRAELPEAAICLVAGNHDAPKTTETGCILRLFSDLGIHVADSEPQRFAFPDRALSILAVPDTPAAQSVAFEPDPGARFNVLVLHGEIAGVLPPRATPTDRATVEIAPEALGAERWSYVALGHYHVHRRIAPNAYYAGAIDYTSQNIWGELAEERETATGGKGIVERDLATGTHRFHALRVTRALADLVPIDARDMSAAELDAAIRDRVEGCPGGIDDKIVRLIVKDVPRHIVRELDPRAQRDYRRRALHFHLDTRRPELLRTRGQGSPSRRPSLLETVEQRLRERTVPAGVDRGALVALGLRYLRDAETAQPVDVVTDLA